MGSADVDREATIGSIIDDAVGMLGRFARKALSDEDRTDPGLPIAGIDGEPDALSVGCHV